MQSWIALLLIVHATAASTVKAVFKQFLHKQKKKNILKLANFENSCMSV